MFLVSPADELAEIRAEIARLRLRERQLRQHFLQNPDQGDKGRWSCVQVSVTHQRRFSTALLPDHILSDPRYLETTVVQSVICVPSRFSVTVALQGDLAGAPDRVH
jgi:hypothetical protein